MYRGEVLSNVPVHLSMVQSLERIVEWIGVQQYSGKYVIEVGAGSGHLARILARAARSVLVFEPAIGLRPEMLPEKNIELINELFTASLVSEPADLIVCRQVLEHVADPLALLYEMRTALKDNGWLYLEVPRAEYIEKHAALFDLHCAHVQYFYEENLLALAAKAGFVAERQQLLKGGHDFGVLLYSQHRNSFDIEPVVRDFDDLGARLEHRRSQSRTFLAELSGEVALYGATWQGITFLNIFQQDCRFTLAMDDNADYTGYALYSREQILPVCLPTVRTLTDISVVLITAYLHDLAIADRLRATGFLGRIFSIRNEEIADSFHAL
jgi:2-polyprenyl-3-methyl-5-hydroxy-6-metoxy-1,4-benzoquinol methylase